MNTLDFKRNELFLRNSFTTVGKYGLAKIKKDCIDLENIKLISCSDAKNNDKPENYENGIHFFVDDYRFNGIYKNPERTLEKYSKYKFLLTPDFSLYADMPTWRQIENVGKNRWVGAYWQSKGLKVIPTISWSLQNSYDFCFDGIEKGSIVAIGMIGCKRSKEAFLRGYNEMLKKIEPTCIICLGKPFAEMKGNIIEIDYNTTRKFKH